MAPLTVRGNYREVAAEYFCGTDGKPYRLADFHVEILTAMFEGGRLCVNIPTDHAKSSLGCFLFPLMSLMDNPNESHIICGANINDSRRRVQTLEREIETNKALTRDFPHVARPDDKEGRLWTATQFNVQGRTINKPNPSVIASAIGANDLKGRRGKLVMDDCEGEDAQWSPTKRAQLYSWLKLEAWRCYEDRMESDRPLLCMLGTPFDVDSIYFKIESEGWNVIRYPCYLKEWVVDWQGRNDYRPTYLWPEKVKKVEDARKSLTKIQFSIAYRMDPTGGDPNRLSTEQIIDRMSESPQVEDGFKGFIALDPASGATGPRVDYCGIAVAKIRWPMGDLLPEVEIEEAYSYPGGLFEQVHLCADLHAKYKYPVLYESNAQQGGTYADAFRHLHPEVPVLQHFTSHKSKFDTQMGLSVIRRLVVESKMFIRPEQMESEGVRQFIQELRDLIPPFKAHNHISAAIWFAFRHSYEKVARYKGRTIRSAYDALHPLAAAGIVRGEYPARRSRAGLNFGLRSVYGYTSRRDNVLQREMRKEIEAFERARRGPEDARRALEAAEARFNERVNR